MFSISTSSGEVHGSIPDTIKIGLLMQDKSSVDAVNGACLAIEKINKSAYASGYYFLIEARSMEGPWGTGAKETVNLVFRDASILIVSADGRNSHLAEQVSAKTQVPMISIQSSDPTLAQAFIPWYFNCVPDDIRQSEILLNVINQKRYKRPLVISDNSYDNLMQSATILKTGKRLNYNLSHFSINDFQDKAELIRSIKNCNPDCMVLFLNPASAADIITRLNNQGIRSGLFGSLSFCKEKISNSLLSSLEGMTLISPGYLFSEKGQEFTRHYIKSYGASPCSTAAFAYDAVNALVESIQSSPSLGFSGLKEKLAHARVKGITGNFWFDNTGSRYGTIQLMTIKDGHFIKID
jgi:branched-chain amino acid transport system substrate-binding protein